MKEFKWDENNVSLFAKEYSNKSIVGGVWQYLSVEDCMDCFKASKQPKPEWEILQGYSKEKGIHTWRSNLEACDHPCDKSGCKIHSVKRLSDGEVFTVGDEVGVIDDLGLLGPIRITGFECGVKGRGMDACFDENPFAGKWSILKIGRPFRRQNPVEVLQAAANGKMAIWMTPAEMEKLKKFLKTL